MESECGCEITSPFSSSLIYLDKKCIGLSEQFQLLLILRDVHSPLDRIFCVGEVVCPDYKTGSVFTDGNEDSARPSLTTPVKSPIKFRT